MRIKDHQNHHEDTLEANLIGFTTQQQYVLLSRLQTREPYPIEYCCN